MKNVFLIIGVSLIAVSTFSSCDSPAKKVDIAEENVTQAKDDLEEAEDEYLEEVANFKMESNQKITANEKAIADFKIHMKNEKKEMNASYNAEIAAMEKRNYDMKVRMEAYNETGKEKWQSFKDEFNHDMDALGKSLKDFTVNNK